VSQALERVRTVAQAKEKERFTALLHHVNPAMLRTAFYALKRDAAPGVDGVTWADYEADLGDCLEIGGAGVEVVVSRLISDRR
jgi:hypothetical protein